MTSLAGNHDKSMRQSHALACQVSPVASEAARVRRLVNGGDAGRDAHTRALGGRLTMELFRSKLIRLRPAREDQTCRRDSDNRDRSEHPIPQ